MGSISFINKKDSDGGSLKPNIFMQETEPETKEGIWIQSNKDISKIETIENLITGKGEWTNIYSNIPYNFYRGRAVSIGTDIYLFSGDDSLEDKQKAYKYDTTNNTYTQLTNIPYAFNSGEIIAIGTNIYLFGGYSLDNTILKTAYKYDTLTDTYTKLANIPYGYYDAGIAAIETDIYLFGTSHTDKLKVYKYDTLTNSYTQLEDISVVSSYSNIKCTAINNDIYIIIDGSLYKYDIQTKSYSNLTKPPFSVDNKTGITTIKNSIYLFGGGNSVINIAYKYDTLTDTYTQLTNIPNGFQSGSAVSVNNKIFLLGGSNNMNMVQVYELASYSFDDKSIILVQGTGQYKTQLYENKDIDGRLLYSFDDVKYNTTEDGLDDTLPTYYGTGTEWVKFKN